MKTQEHKLQYVMEVAGECWHEAVMELGNLICSNCGIQEPYIPRNPSPTDLNELFRLADKLHFRYSIHKQSVNSFRAHIRTADFIWLSSEDGPTLAEALLNALFIATGGKEK